MKRLAAHGGRRDRHLLGRLLAAGAGAVVLGVAGSAWADPTSDEEVAARLYSPRAGWAATLRAAREALVAAPDSGHDPDAALAALCRRIQDDFPVEWDWALQDGGTDFFERWLGSGAQEYLEEQMLVRVLEELGAARAAPRAGDDRLELYARACEERRARRLESLVARAPRVVFTKHPTVRPSFFAYTEGQSDAQHERHFLPGSALCLLEIGEPRPHVKTLLEDGTGTIRDPAVSWDGRRVLFSWKKSLDGDDYHLYELEIESGQVRQLTFGLGFADYEPAYLPDGDIIFASTRCVQTVDCWWTEVSNLYTCDRDGRYLRRLGFDQVHTVFPAVLDDGRVIYTRWDYSDRGQIFPQALFQMNPDGTGQTEFYGNNSWFPTTIAHARGIPGTQKVMAIFCGHHTAQAGKLGVIDPARGRQENAGAQLIAPVRSTPAERVDAYGQEGALFQYPYPLAEREFLVTFAPLGWSWRDGHFGVYWMDLDGRRELLAHDPHLPCNQPVPFVARAAPAPRPANVDYRRSDGTYYVQDVYLGPGLAGVSRGTVRRLRVVALEFRAAGVGNNYSTGAAGDALICTPVAIGNGSWDVKKVVGETPVQPDGSAFFRVPARTPVYFQALDHKGHAIQSMRSWSTLQPGENQACIGCHEHKNSAPVAAGGGTLALRAGPVALEPFYGPPRGFSFAREIQPILDRHCVRCHFDRRAAPPPEEAPRAPAAGASEAGVPLTEPGAVRRAFSLRADTVRDAKSGRHWSDAYLALTGARPRDLPWDTGVYVAEPAGRLVNWISSQSPPEPLPPRSAGAARSELLAMLERGHCDVRLDREEAEKLACWIDLLVPFCGDYREAHAWSAEEQAKYERYQRKRDAMAALEQQNTGALILDRSASPPAGSGP